MVRTSWTAPDLPAATHTRPPRCVSMPGCLGQAGQDSFHLSMIRASRSQPRTEIVAVPSANIAPDAGGQAQPAGGKDPEQVSVGKEEGVPGDVAARRSARRPDRRAGRRRRRSRRRATVRARSSSPGRSARISVGQAAFERAVVPFAAGRSSTWATAPKPASRRGLGRSRQRAGQDEAERMAGAAAGRAPGPALAGGRSAARRCGRCGAAEPRPFGLAVADQPDPSLVRRPGRQSAVIRRAACSGRCACPGGPGRRARPRRTRAAASRGSGASHDAGHLADRGVVPVDLVVVELAPVGDHRLEPFDLVLEVRDVARPT